MLFFFNIQWTIAGQLNTVLLTLVLPLQEREWLCRGKKHKLVLVYLKFMIFFPSSFPEMTPVVDNKNGVFPAATLLLSNLIRERKKVVNIDV